MDYESVRQQTRDAVLARPFTRVTGKPTFEQKEKFIEEAEDLAMNFAVSYPWSGQHGLLAEIMGAHKYLTETGWRARERTQSWGLRWPVGLK